MIVVLGSVIAYFAAILLIAVAFTVACFFFRCLKFMFTMWGYYLNQPPEARDRRWD